MLTKKSPQRGHGSSSLLLKGGGYRRIDSLSLQRQERKFGLSGRGTGKRLFSNANREKNEGGGGRVYAGKETDLLSLREGMNGAGRGKRFPGK